MYDAYPQPLPSNDLIARDRIYAVEKRLDERISAIDKRVDGISDQLSRLMWLGISTLLVTVGTLAGMLLRLPSR